MADRRHIAAKSLPFVLAGVFLVFILASGFFDASRRGKLVRLPFVIAKAGPKIAFDTEEYDFGDISDVETVETEFQIKNVGDEPLEIENIRTSCGCTAFVIGDRTIDPNGSESLKISLNATAKQGDIIKQIQITSNDSDTPERTLSIRAHVIALDQAHANREAAAIFKGDCAACHADRAGGKTGWDLYESVCDFCHHPAEAKRAETGQDVIDEAQNDDPEYLEKVLTDSKPGVPMPAWSKKRGGPLSRSQIKSLVKLLTE